MAVFVEPLVVVSVFVDTVVVDDVFGAGATVVLAFAFSVVSSLCNLSRSEITSESFVSRLLTLASESKSFVSEFAATGAVLDFGLSAYVRLELEEVVDVVEVVVTGLGTA